MLCENFSVDPNTVVREDTQVPLHNGFKKFKTLWTGLDFPFFNELIGNFLGNGFSGKLKRSFL